MGRKSPPRELLPVTACIPCSSLWTNQHTWKSTDLEFSCGSPQQARFWDIRCITHHKQTLAGTPGDYAGLEFSTKAVKHGVLGGCPLFPRQLWDTVEREHRSHPCSQVSFEEESQNPPAVGHWKPLMPSKGNKEEAESGCQDAGGVHEPQSTEQLNVSRLRSSSVEIREKGSEFLRDELHKAQKELKLKDKECERLSKVREQLEQELEELTASLFEEAHKMVREANTKQAAAEKQLREARGKIDMLQAEVTALKTLVITSTPSSPNRELHPQLQSPSKAGFRKGHGRNKSTSSAMVSAASQNVAPEPVSRECRESGFPALLSLLLCILPGKAIHITYEPGWQALGADASSFSSSSRQVTNLWEWVGPTCLSHFQPFSSSFLLC
ncbi:guanine nucleotide exchange factor for Rab-3A isoform X5 [Pyrgilauda ruficollis]|uniref:guanine nucleotide exchange factor for Rab-3A isoform X5 n=1 Tax=Pyrgilauda ruficollis TaxID=221976 RepID=UPI001B882BCB|nr:guanine nucleotide exchange factor for Rab-3A isoform X5 [Pyrgilauda ruficollis]